MKPLNAKPEPLPAARTRTESLRLKLEDEILTRRIGPGQKLDEEELARRFGLSRTPVREALKAMTSSGLVETRPHQGVFVAVLTGRLIAEMTETMAALETICAELAARRHTIGDRTRILTAQEACEQTASRGDPGAFYTANVAFHEAIYRASGNEFLGHQTRSLRQRLEPYRRRVSYHPGLIAKSNGEHRRIVAAIFAMDEAAANQAMRQHLEALRDTIATLVDPEAAGVPARRRPAPAAEA